MYDRASKQVHLFQRGDRRKKVSANVLDLDDPELEETIGETLFAKLLEVGRRMPFEEPHCSFPLVATARGYT